MYKSFLRVAVMVLLAHAVNLKCAAQMMQGKTEHNFELADSVFLLDGKPFQIISGEIHYPRVPREAWRARMKMAKAMGLNTICLLYTSPSPRDS